jgi:hypothetical protein
LFQIYHPYVDSEAIALGEKFGFSVCLSQEKGYDYMAGGSGKILNRKVVQKIVDIGQPEKRSFFSLYFIYGYKLAYENCEYCESVFSTNI